jgi:hypothetical protein
MKINWIYGDDAGFWDSADGRFAISPIYIGRTTPQGYELWDATLDLGKRTKGGFFTVAQAKAAAVARVTKVVDTLNGA